jgi:hypothetical protein
MDGGGDGLWRTLTRIYVSVLACGVCVPALAVLPVLGGVGSLFVTTLFGGVGLVVAGGVVAVVDARLERREGPLLAAAETRVGDDDPAIDG